MVLSIELFPICSKTSRVLCQRSAAAYGYFQCKLLVINSIHLKCTSVSFAYLRLKRTYQWHNSFAMLAGQWRSRTHLVSWCVPAEPSYTVVSNINIGSRRTYRKDHLWLLLSRISRPFMELVQIQLPQLKSDINLFFHKSILFLSSVKKIYLTS